MLWDLCSEADLSTHLTTLRTTVLSANMYLQGKSLTFDKTDTVIHVDIRG